MAGAAVLVLFGFEVTAWKIPVRGATFDVALCADESRI